jgi:hypothetical protein
MSDPESWLEQAKLAVANRWEEFEELKSQKN